MVFTRDNVTNVNVSLLRLSRLLLPSILKLPSLLLIKVLLELFRNGELSDSLSATNGTFILLFLCEFYSSFVEEELVFDMVLEPHNDVVPDGAHPFLTLTHFGSDTGVYVSIKVPTLNISKVSSLNGHREAHRNYLPSVVIVGISKRFLRI